MQYPISGYSGTSVNYNQNYGAGHSNKTADSSAGSASQAQSSQETKAPSRAEQFDVGALVDRIWGFANQRISDAKANGASDQEIDDLFSAAEKGVKQGFNDAKDILNDLGELDDELALKIDSAYGQIMDRLADQDLSVGSTDSLPTTPLTSSDTSSVDRQINMYQYERQTFSLDLVTNQGDKIMIRSVAQSESTLEDSRFGNKSSTTWGTQQSSAFELVIQGDLSEQEMADLDALLAQVNEIANEFYEGDFDKAFNMASELNIDGSSLRSMDLSMKEVEAKGVGVYAEVADQPASLPKGLQPLKDYADKLVANQTQWFDKFNSGESFLQAIENHPRNDGRLLETLTALLS